MPFQLGIGELILIAVVALVVLGPTKLPDAARQAGRAIGELRRLSSGFQAELKDALAEPLDGIPRTAASAPAPTLPPLEASSPDPDDEPGCEPEHARPPPPVSGGALAAPRRPPASDTEPTA